MADSGNEQGGSTMFAEDTSSSVFEEGSSSFGATESDSPLSIPIEMGPVTADPVRETPIGAEATSSTPGIGSMGFGDAHTGETSTPVGEEDTMGTGGVSSGDVGGDSGTVRHTQSVVPNVESVVAMDPSIVRPIESVVAMGESTVGGDSTVGDNRSAAQYTESTVRDTESAVGGDQSTVATLEGLEAMEIDPPGTGTPLPHIAINLGGIDIVVEKTSGQESGSQAVVISGDVLGATLVTEITIGGEHVVTDVLVVRGGPGDRDVQVEDVVGESSTDSEEIPLVRRIAPDPAIAIGIARVPEESADREVEVSEPPLFVPAVGFSCRPGLTLADTLEGREMRTLWQLCRSLPSLRIF